MNPQTSLMFQPKSLLHINSTYLGHHASPFSSPVRGSLIPPEQIQIFESPSLCMQHLGSIEQLVYSQFQKMKDDQRSQEQQEQLQQCQLEQEQREMWRNHLKQGGVAASID